MMISPRLLCVALASLSFLVMAQQTEDDNTSASIQTRQGPFEIVWDTVYDISLDFPRGQLLDDPEEWEEATRVYLEDFFRAEADRGAVLIFDYATELTITNQEMEEINGVDTLRLTWRQYVYYKAYEGARSPRYYIVYPFLDYFVNYNYGLYLRKAISGWNRLRIPFVVPSIDGPTEATTANPTTSSPTRTAHPTGIVPLPTSEPTSHPTSRPTPRPTFSPTTASPTSQPTSRPTHEPTAAPTSGPTLGPTLGPTASPTDQPTATPTATPTALPTAGPTNKPTALPTPGPTATPTALPTAGPTNKPIAAPTASPTGRPTTTTASPTTLPTTLAPTTSLAPSDLELEPSVPPTQTLSPTPRITVAMPTAPPEKVEVTVTGIRLTLENAGELEIDDWASWELVTESWFANYYYEAQQQQRLLLDDTNYRHHHRRQLQTEDSASQVTDLATAVTITGTTTTLQNNRMVNTITYDQSLSYFAGPQALTPLHYVLLPFDDDQANAQYAAQLQNLTKNWDNLATPIAPPAVSRTGQVTGIDAGTDQDNDSNKSGIGGGGIVGIVLGALLVVCLIAFGSVYYVHVHRSRPDRFANMEKPGGGLIQVEDDVSDFDVDVEKSQLPNDPIPSLEGAYALQSNLTEDFEYHRAYILSSPSKEDFSDHGEVIYDYSNIHEKGPTTKAAITPLHEYPDDSDEVSTGLLKRTRTPKLSKDDLSTVSTKASQGSSSSSSRGSRRRSADDGSQRILDDLQLTSSSSGEATSTRREKSRQQKLRNKDSPPSDGNHHRSAATTTTAMTTASDSLFSSSDSVRLGTSNSHQSHPHSHLISRVPSRGEESSIATSDLSSLKGTSILSHTSSETIITVHAPPGKLGVILDTPNEGPPVVYAIKDSCTVREQVCVGDRLTAVDDENVAHLSAIKASKLIARKGANPSRKLTLIRTIQAS